MSVALTVRIAPELLARAEARAIRLGLDRARYVRGLIERDLTAVEANSRHQFASEDLVGAFRLGGKSATNLRARQALHQRAARLREANR